MVVDNQTIYSLLSGHDSTNNDTYHDLCNTITNNFDAILHSGRKLPFDWSGPIEWRYRELNKPADRVCNITFDTETSFTWKQPNYDSFINNNNNLYISSDGGCRYKGHSATGWRIIAVHSDNNTAVVIAHGGTLIKQNLPSLHVELLALKEVTDLLYDTIVNNDNNKRQTTTRQH